MDTDNKEKDMPDTTPSPSDLAAKAQSAGHGAAGDQDNGRTPDKNPDTDAKSYTPPASQEELDRLIQERIARERKKYADYDDLKKKAQLYQEIEDSKKSAEEKAAERIQALEAKLRAQTIESARAKAAADHGVPADLIGGSTEEEIEQSARKLAEYIKEQSSPQKTRPLYLQGENTGEGAPGGGDWLRQMLSGQ